MSDMMILCERHLIKSTHPFYDECDKLTFLAKNLYKEFIQCYIVLSKR